MYNDDVIFFVAFDRREATILNDYYLIAGASWSLLKKGERVIVVQELPTGYYLVKATRNTTVKMNMTEVKRIVSDSNIVGQNNNGAAVSSGQYSEPTSPSDLSDTGPVISIMIQQSPDSNIVPSDSFQSNISDDSGIVESSKRVSNVSTKEDDEDKSVSIAVGVHLENGNGNGNGELGFSATFKAHSTASLPTNFHLSNGKLSTPPASSRITNSVSFCVASEHLGKDQVNLPLIGSVPPSVLDCFVNQMFAPSFVKPHSSNFVLQPPPAKSPATPAKKKKRH